jgi:hypothetical protein
MSAEEDAQLDPPAYAGLAGISLDVRIRARWGGGAAAAEGGFLFTHRGYSGPAVLDISHLAVRSRLAGRERASLRVRWSDLDRDAWLSTLQTHTGLVLSAVARKLPARLAERLLVESGIPLDRRAAELRTSERTMLVDLLTSYVLPWTSDEGFRKAEVTGGGVALDEVDTRTLESRLCPGLFLCGEILDAFGPIGGHNFAWAWATGGWRVWELPRNQQPAINNLQVGERRISAPEGFRCHFHVAIFSRDPRCDRRHFIRTDRHRAAIRQINNRPPAAQTPPAWTPSFTPIRRNVGFYRGRRHNRLSSTRARSSWLTASFRTQGRSASMAERAVHNHGVDLLINPAPSRRPHPGNIVFQGMRNTSSLTSALSTAEAGGGSWTPGAPPARQLCAARTSRTPGGSSSERMVSGKFWRAHTSGDITVTFERANVVHMGDLMFNRRHPVVDRPQARR